MIDLETKAISSSSAPIASAPAASAPAAKANPSPAEPTKSQSAPANYHTPTATKSVDKVEPKSAFKEEFSPESSPAPSPKVQPEEPKVEAKSLEIDQPESEDEEPTAKEEPKTTIAPTPASSGVSVVSFVVQFDRLKADSSAPESAPRQEALGQSYHPHSRLSLRCRLRPVRC